MSTEPAPLRIAARYCGPPGSANGGWTSGLLAERVLASYDTPAVRVTLRRPPPLERDLTVAGHADGVRLLDGDLLVAEAEPAEVVEVVDGLDAATACEAECRFGRDQDHPFPTCYVCGPDRERGDGMRLAPGPVGARRVACTWQPADPPGLPDLWAALDCPGGWAAGIGRRPMVLGRMTAQVDPVAGRGPYVVTGEHRGTSGRTSHAATALHDQRGRLVGRSEQVWVSVDPATFGQSARP